MAMTIQFKQKLAIIALLLAINVTLSVTCILYSQYWYIFIVPLSLSMAFSCLCVLLIIAVNTFKLIKGTKIPEVSASRNMAFVVPCYNENYDELSRTITSLEQQQHLDQHKSVMIVICDGRVKGSTSENTTDAILKDLLKESIHASMLFPSAYTTWTGVSMDIEIVYGETKKRPFICFIKNENMGKRDSLVFVRKLLFSHNQNYANNAGYYTDEVMKFFKEYCSKYNFDKFDYIVGTDADTVFADDCTYELLKEIETDDKTHGVVGFVKISPSCPKWSFWTIYQQTEYIIAQCLRRVQQSIVTHKVSCLSGCVQILRISEETSGNTILSAFIKYPEENANIFKHILSFASEDRNHVCLMLHNFPYVRTRQCIKASAYTIVPMNITTFRSQRRRWSLGATCNDLLLTFMTGINWYERIGAIFNVMTYCMCWFIVVATGVFIYSIIKSPNIIMLYLSTMMLIPLFYNVCNVFWAPFDSMTDRMRYLLGMIVYYVFGPFINIGITTYSIAHMDCFKWGKTRTVAQTETSNA